MEKFFIPPGIRFLPTKEEALFYYLRPAINDEPLPCNYVVKADIYGKDKEPWKLFDNNSEDPIWVITKLKRRNKSKIDRTAGCGCWLNQSNNNIEDSQGNLIGFDKYFTWKKDGSRSNNSNWTMHEYSFSDKSLSDFVICEIKHKADKKRKVDDIHDVGDEDMSMSVTKKNCVANTDGDQLELSSASVNHEDNNHIHDLSVDVETSGLASASASASVSFTPKPNNKDLWREYLEAILFASE